MANPRNNRQLSNFFDNNHGIAGMGPMFDAYVPPTPPTPPAASSTFDAASAGQLAAERANRSLHARLAAEQGGAGAAPFSPIRRNAGTGAKSGAATGASTPKGNKFGNLFAPGLMDNLKGTFGNIANPQFNWNKQTGVQGWGKNLGSYATIGNALYQGHNAAQGLEELSDSRADTEELMNDLINASYNNNMLAYDLNSDQKKLLRELRSGNYDTGVDLNDIRPMDILGGAAKGGISGFLYGGIPGAVVGALGSGANSAVDSLNRAQSGKMDELDALYQSILQSEDQQNALKKQRMYAAMGY